MYYVPPPDYRGYQAPVFNPSTFVAPENLIPPPDYARYEPQVDYELPVPTKQESSRGRPRLPSVRKETVIQETPILPQPQERIVAPRIHIQDTTVEDQRNKPLTIQISPAETEKRVVREDRREPEQRKNFFDQPYAVHSYLEDKDKLERDTFLNESTRSHIRSIGVPVLPPLGRDFSDFGGQSAAQNKAFIRHLENHRKFDTMKSLKSCKDCPLCQMMLGAGFHEEIEEDARRRRPDVRNIFESEAEVDWSLTRRSYTERAEGEISVGFREKVQILRTERTHALCRKTDGSMGWLPLNVVQNY